MPTVTPSVSASDTTGVTPSVSLTADDFSLFDLPATHALDRALLDARWRALQAQVHPDRHVGRDAAAQRLAMQQSVRVNEAYRRLRDPLKRAAYLCELQGAPVDAERNTAMPSAFLVHQMQWREALDEVKTLAELDALEQEVSSTHNTLMQSVADRLDVQHDAHQAAQDVRALMFVERFRDDLERQRESLVNMQEASD